MKKMFFIVLFLLASVSQAQDLSNLNQSDIEMLMKQAEMAQVCMEKVDQKRLEELSQDAQAKGAEIQQMCADGERAAAQDEALRYGKQMAKEPVLIEVRDCTGEMGSWLPQLAWAMLESGAEPPRHVCDL